MFYTRLGPAGQRAHTPQAGTAPLGSCQQHSWQRPPVCHEAHAGRPRTEHQHLLRSTGFVCGLRPRLRGWRLLLGHTEALQSANGLGHASTALQSVGWPAARQFPWPLIGSPLACRCHAGFGPALSWPMRTARRSPTAATTSNSSTPPAAEADREFCGVTRGGHMAKQPAPQGLHKRRPLRAKAWVVHETLHAVLISCSDAAILQAPSVAHRA